MYKTSTGSLRPRLALCPAGVAPAVACAAPAGGKPWPPSLSWRLLALLAVSASLAGGRSSPSLWDGSDGAHGGSDKCPEGPNNAWKKSNHPVRKTWTSESEGRVFTRFSLRLLQMQGFQGSSVEVVTSPQSWPTHWISPEAGISEVMLTFEFCFPSVSLGSLGSSAQDGA